MVMSGRRNPESAPTRRARDKLKGLPALARPPPRPAPDPGQRKSPPVRVTRAVITAAAPKQRSLPLQILIDRDGVSKSVLRILLEEVRHAGIEELCVVVTPGDEQAYREAGV